MYESESDKDGGLSYLKLVSPQSLRLHKKVAYCVGTDLVRLRAFVYALDRSVLACRSRDRHGGCASCGGCLSFHAVGNPFWSYRVSS